MKKKIDLINNKFTLIKISAFAIILVAFALIINPIINKRFNLPIRYELVDACLFEYVNDFDQLEDLSSVVVCAEVLGDSKNVLLKNDEHIYYGYTLTNIKVKEVFSGDVNVDDILPMVEEYYVIESSTEKIIRGLGYYTPASVGSEYILFLNRSKREDTNDKLYGTYYMTGVGKSRYLVKSNSRSTKAIEEDTNLVDIPEREQEIYNEIYEKVKDKYIY